MVKKIVKFIFVQQYRIQKMVSFSTKSQHSRFLKILVRNRLLTRYKISIGEHTRIGNNLTIPHQFNIVIGDGVSIGDNCTIYHNVTIGQKHGRYPVIGDKVSIFPGAILIGDINIGDNVTIGAGSIVLNNISSNSIVAGNPARVIKIKSEE